MIRGREKTKVNNVCDWMIVDSVKDGIHLKNRQSVKLLEIKPVNFQLLSENEQIGILESYRRLLKQYAGTIQIVVVPFQTDVKEHLSSIQKYSYGNEKLKTMTNEYIQLVNQLIGEKKSITRRFFVVIQKEKNWEEKILLLKDGFSACGNEVEECNDKNTIEVLQKYFHQNRNRIEQEDKTSFCPTVVDTTNPHYLLVDDTYVASLFVSHYQSAMEGGFLQPLLSSDIAFTVSMFYEKRDTYETIKELTGVIGNSGANIQMAGDNQMDIDLLKGSYENAKYIKKQLQVEDDELYDFTIYLLVSAPSTEILTNYLHKIENLLIGCGLTARRGIFRQEEIFQSCLPILQQSKTMKEICKRNVLGSGLISSYPFLSNELCDKNGVFMGLNYFNHSVVMVDRFDSEKYKNGNMCVIGASGTGKSYFMKLLMTRNRLLNIEQFVIDPDREYTNICNELGGTLINFGEENLINVMEIRETILEEGESFLRNKLQKLMTFFSIIFPDLLAEEKSMLEEKLIVCYGQKGITFDNQSLYTGEQIGKLVSKKIFKSSQDMPILGDLYQLLSRDKNMHRIAKLLKPYVSGALQFMNHATNVDLNNKLVVADVYHVEEKNLPMVLFTITEFFWDKIQSNRGRKKIIYLDEVWRFIHHNKETAEFVFKIFKTIRKYGGAATAVTQDINDFFSLDDGNYGKGILSNASMKCIFQVEENDMQKLKEIMHLSEVELYQIMNIERGTCLMHVGRNHLMVKVLSSPYEHQFISTDRKDL